jgi:hypothetical protein
MSLRMKPARLLEIVDLIKHYMIVNEQAQEDMKEEMERALKDLQNAIPKTKSEATCVECGCDLNARIVEHIYPCTSIPF